MPIKDHAVFVLFLVAITLAVYYDSFNNSFVYDDYPFIIENKHIRKLDIASIIANFTKRSSTSSSESLSRDVWRPLVTTSFAIDYKFWDLKAHFYHIENTILHIINALLVYIATFLILNNGLTAFIAGLVFAIHPAQTEAVTWVSGRSNVLFLMFFLSAFIFHIRQRRYKERLPNYVLSLALFVLSLFSKEMAITLPFLLILYDIYFYPQKDIKDYLNHYLPFFLIAAFYVLARFSVLGVIAQQDDWWGGSISYTILTTLKTIAGYIRLLFIPTSLRIIYLVDIPKSILEGDVLIALVVLFLIAGLFFIFRRRKEILFYILFFFVTLLPVYNIVPFKAVMAERFLYLPIIAFASLAGILFSSLKSKFDKDARAKKIINSIFIAIFILYGFMTIARNVEWRDELTIYMTEEARSPASSKAHYNLGYAYAKKADENAGSKELFASYHALAIKEFEEAVSVNPQSQVAYFAMANSYNALGLCDLAIKNFKKAIAIEGAYYIYNNLAIAYYRKGMCDEAILASIRALELRPDYADTYFNLANAYFKKGEYAKSKRAALAAVKLGASSPSILEKINKLQESGY